jgi:hypothetical protein
MELNEKEIEAVNGLIALGIQAIHKDVKALKLYLMRADYWSYILLPDGMFKSLEQYKTYILRELLEE